MLKVIFKNKNTSRIMAFFAGSVIFEACRKALEKEAKAQGCKLETKDRVFSSVDFGEETDAVLVYSETQTHAEKIACFNGEDLYAACLDSLTEYVEKGRMIITESTHYPYDDKEDWCEPLWASIKEKDDMQETFGEKYWLQLPEV